MGRRVERSGKAERANAGRCNGRDVNRDFPDTRVVKFPVIRRNATLFAFSRIPNVRCENSGTPCTLCVNTDPEITHCSLPVGAACDADVGCSSGICASGLSTAA